MTTHEKLFKRAQRVAPGGVHSPVRSFKSVGGVPVFFREANGAWLVDEDGKRYADLMNAWGPMILGHGHPAVIDAIHKQVDKGLTYGAPTRADVELAELIVDMVPSIDRVRFVSTGTEACMTSVRIARGATGRSLIVKFDGCYHGHADTFLVGAGSGALTHGIPSSLGVPPETAALTLLLPFNDLTALDKTFSQHGHAIAAVIVEPVAGNMGCIVPSKEFLEGLRSLCTRYGSVLIFDEVMTGFRLALGGAQERFGIEADLVTYGKVVGGGMPLAAVAGKTELMDMLSPLGTVYQAGTLSAHPVAVACGKATLMVLRDNPEVYTDIGAVTLELAAGFTERLQPLSWPFTINHIGSMMSVFFHDRAVTDLASASSADLGRFASMFHGLLSRGIALPPSGLESWFISAAVTSDVAAHILDGVTHWVDAELHTNKRI